MPSSTRDLLDLWDYRRRVEEIYREVRATREPAEAWGFWRTARDELFATHPQSPYPEEARRTYQPLPYFDYDPAWRLETEVTPFDVGDLDVAHSGEGLTLFAPFGRVELETPTGPAVLTLLWLDAYGGGVFLPFRDGTNGDTTYGGGRYLLDTVKGADLGRTNSTVILDFNFSYHPSCVHDSRWSCPLAPPANRLSIDVPVGERLHPRE